MRLHTDKITIDIIFRCIRATHGTVALNLAEHGSRTHERAFEIQLTGSNTRLNMAGTAKAALWDEWGEVLQRLYMFDPQMRCGSATNPNYANREHFHWATGHRNFVGEPRCNHHWAFDAFSITRAYSVHSCTKHNCPATRRFTSDWGLIDESYAERTTAAAAA